MSILSLATPLGATEDDATARSETFSAFMRHREAAAERRIVHHLRSQTDARLMRLGFSAGDIAALRAGKLQLPVR